MPAESRYEFEVWDGLRVGVVCSKAALEAQLSVDCRRWTGRVDRGTTRLRRVAATNGQHPSYCAAAPRAGQTSVVRRVRRTRGRQCRRWTARRQRLDSLAERWAPPLQLSPVTSDPDKAREWVNAFKTTGVEGRS